MVLSKLRQNLSWSSRNCPETLVQLREKFPHEKFAKLDNALKNADGNYLEAVKDLNATQTQRVVSPMQQMQQPPPRKLKRPSQSQHTGYHPGLGLHNANMHSNYQLPLVQNQWNNIQPHHASPQYQPGYMGPPQHYPAPTYVRSEPLTPVLQNLRQPPNVLIPVPPLPTAFQLSQQQYIHPWTPYQPVAPWGDPRASAAVPLYELPPPDLMDYDMSYLISVRMLLEWNKHMEDRHWEEVRRGRNAALRWELGEDRDDGCTIM